MDIGFSMPVGLSTRKQCWTHLNWRFLCFFSAPSAYRSINIYFLPLLTNQRITDCWKSSCPASQRRDISNCSGPDVKHWISSKDRDPTGPLWVFSSVWQPSRQNLPLANQNFYCIPLCSENMCLYCGFTSDETCAKCHRKLTAGGLSNHVARVEV